jgi:hypothetical protein
MSRKQDLVTIVGLRVPSIFGFSLAFVPGLMGSVAGFTQLKAASFTKAGTLFAVGVFLVNYSLDFLARSVRPNRLLLDEDGFSLQTWCRTSRWLWTDYRGVWGMGYLMLRVADGSESNRNIPIGHWSRDLEHRLYRFVSSKGIEVPEPSLLHPSLKPLFFLSGALVLFALAVALTGLRQ